MIAFKLTGNPSKNLAPTVIRTALTLSIIAATLPVSALTLVTNRDNLGENDRIDWSKLGIFNPFKMPPDFSKFLSNTFPIASKQGLQTSVTISNSNLPPTVALPITPPFVFRVDEIPNGIPANYGLGDAVLFTGSEPRQFPAPGNPGPISLMFSSPVVAAGTQIAVDDTPNFVATLEVYDAANNLLQAFSLPGTSSTIIDNSALFLGVRSETANISRLVYYTNISNRAIGINAVSLAIISEPTTTVGLLLFSAIIILGIYKNQSR